MMINELLNYNFEAKDIGGGEEKDYKKLFEEKRRDSTFAFVYEKGDSIYAIRDHLGIVPLYYRHKQGKLVFSCQLNDLVEPGDEVDEVGLRPFLAFGTPRLFPLLKSIKIIPPGCVVEIDKTLKSKFVYQYKIKPRKIRTYRTTLKTLTEEFYFLFARAINGLIKQSSVGLLLSGGIDSGLIGLFLNKQGVKVNAYTSAPWGVTSSEIPYAKINAEIANVDNHYIDYLETQKYNDLFLAIPETYGIPHGTTTSLGVASIWQNSPIKEETQIFFGQNSDTMTCSIVQQYYAYYLSFLPLSIRQRIAPLQKHNDIIANYLSQVSLGMYSHNPQLHNFFGNIYSKIGKLTIAGMYVAHTPSDGEVISQPAIQRNILISNPYYNMDLIEFCLGIPLMYRIGLSKQSKIFLSLQKRIIQKISEKYFPHELVYRKKGFTVSLFRDKNSRNFLKMMPDEIKGLPLKHVSHRFAGGVIERWIKYNSLL